MNNKLLKNNLQIENIHSFYNKSKIEENNKTFHHGPKAFLPFALLQIPIHLTCDLLFYQELDPRKQPRISNDPISFRNYLYYPSTWNKVRLLVVVLATCSFRVSHLHPFLG